jgi:hypothetical protein
MTAYNQEEVLSRYTNFLKVRNVGDVVFAWCRRNRGINMYDVNDMIRQLEEWIYDNKTGYNYILKADIGNNQTIQIEGKTWYIAILQRGLDEGLSEEEENDLNPMCMASMALFGIMVSGLIFAFEIEAVRDWAVLCLNENRIYHLQQKKKQQQKKK